jgi:hypothetical protein
MIGRYILSIRDNPLSWLYASRTNADHPPGGKLLGGGLGTREISGVIAVPMKSHRRDKS